MLSSFPHPTSCPSNHSSVTLSGHLFATFKLNSITQLLTEFWKPSTLSVQTHCSFCVLYSFPPTTLTFGIPTYYLVKWSYFLVLASTEAIVFGTQTKNLYYSTFNPGGPPDVSIQTSTPLSRSGVFC